MKINIIALGKLSKDYQSLFAHYAKMINKYARLQVIEIKEALLPANESKGEITNALLSEGKEILKHVKDRDYVYVLSPNGAMIPSEVFSSDLINAFSLGGSQVTFIIGSSYGLSQEVYKRANTTLSFSLLTFPHQLARIILVEQLVRAFKIYNNERYHK